MRHPEDLITTAEAAAIRRCVPDNIRRLAREGKLPIAAIVGRGQRLYKRSDVERLPDTRAAQTVRG